MRSSKIVCSIIGLIAIFVNGVVYDCNADDVDSGKEAQKLARQIKEKAQSKQDLEKAQKKFHEAVVFFNKAGSKKDAAVSLHEIASIYEDMADHDKAIEYYEKSLALRKEINDVRGEGYCINAMGLVYYYMAQFDKSLATYRRALSISEQVSDKHLEAIVMQNMANTEVKLGNNKLARDYLEKSLATFKARQNKKSEAGCLNDLGNVNRQTGNYQKALDNYEKALLIYAESNNFSAQSRTINNIGLVYLALGKYQKAKDSFDKSLEIKKKRDDEKGMSNTYNNIGLVYLYSGQYSLALENFQKGLVLYRKVMNRHGESSALGNIGRVYAQWGKPDEALSSYQASVRISTDIGVSTRWSKDLIANLYMDKGDLQNAEAFLKESNYNQSWGRYHLIKGDYDAAETAYQKLLNSSEKNQNAEGLFIAYVGLGKVFEAKEDYVQAEVYFEKGMALAEDIRSMMLPAERKNFFDYKTGGFYRSEPAKGLTRVRMKLNKDAQSIEASEAVRARFFADSISQRSDMGISGVPAEILEKEENLISRLASIKKELSQTNRESKPEVHRALSREAAESQEDLDSFIEILWKKHYQYATVKYPKPVPLKQSAVNPDEFLIVFDVVDEGVGVKLIKGHEILQTNYLKWNAEDLKSDVQKFRHGFETFNLAEFDTDLANSLYRKLLGPLIANIPEQQKIIIIPDGILGVLPFEALVIAGKPTWQKGPYGPVPTGLTYLADKHAISYYQSITALTLLRKAPHSSKSSSARLLVIADPVFSLKDVRAQGASDVKVASSDTEHFSRLMAAIEDTAMGSFRFDRLPETEALASGLGKIYSGSSDIFTGLNASKEKFLSEVAPHLGDYNFVVFATHGLFSNRIPGVNEPFLALTMAPPGTDGFLRMSEVLSLKMNADIVALTACQTGLGKDQSGEGVMSMGRAFQFAGARCAMMSLWSVAESSSVELVESFFREIKKGKTRLDALVEARTQLRQKGYEHPFYWAPFILVGEVGTK